MFFGDYVEAACHAYKRGLIQVTSHRWTLFLLLKLANGITAAIMCIVLRRRLFLSAVNTRCLSRRFDLQRAPPSLYTPFSR